MDTTKQQRYEAQRIAHQESEELREQRKVENERQHAKQLADELKAAEKQERLVRLRATFEMKVPAIGDPVKRIGEFMEKGISLESLKRKVTELEDELKRLESMKDELVAEEGVEGHKWERSMETEVRPKIQAALQLAEPVQI